MSLLWALCPGVLPQLDKVAISDEILPGDIMTQRDQIKRLRGMRDRFRDMGVAINPLDHHGYENDAAHFRLESGHSVMVGLSRNDNTWRAFISHPQDNKYGATSIRVNLGTNEQDVPRLLHRELGCRHVIPEMAEQARRARLVGPRPRRYPTTSVNHIAEGATMPEPPEEV